MSILHLLTILSVVVVHAQDKWPLVGCYLGNSNTYVLSHETQLNEKVMKHEVCQEACDNRGYTYFGFVLGRKCLCGLEINNPRKIPIGFCKWQCTGNKKQKCGGDMATLVFFTNKPTPPTPTTTTPTTTTPTTTTPTTTTPTTTMQPPSAPKLKFIACSQSTTLGLGQCEKAIDGNHNQVDISGGVCAQVNATEMGWWSGKLEAQSFVKEIRIINRQDCCADNLNDIYITANGRLCASYVSEKSFSAKMFKCGVNGQFIRIISKNKGLTLCEVEVFGKPL